MAETQAHGFTWEKDLIQHVYGATDAEMKTIGYTNKIDLPASLNRLDHVDVSMKTTGTKHTVCLGDCLRFYDSVCNGKIHMTVIHYLQQSDTKCLDTITEINLTESVQELFGTLTRPELEELDTLVKAVPQKRSPTPEERTNMYSLRDSLQQKSAAIHLDIKCNSQQSLLQCSFNRFQTFLAEHPARIVATSKTGAFRGGQIATSILSKRRTFR
jgi:hypothetical protein